LKNQPENESKSKFIHVTGGTAFMNVAKWRKSVTISDWGEIVE
jgi:hypothetical protein